MKKGKTVIEAGYIYVPYIPIMKIGIIYEPERFSLTKELKSPYSTKMVDNKYYSKIKLDENRNPKKRKQLSYCV